MNEPIAADTSAAFQGWRRRAGGRWWIAASGATESECLAKLLDAGKRDGPGHCDLMVLPAGEQP